MYTNSLSSYRFAKYTQWAVDFLNSIKLPPSLQHVLRMSLYFLSDISFTKHVVVSGAWSGAYELGCYS